MSLKLTHHYHDRLVVEHGDAPLFEYIYQSKEIPFESPRPYFYPMYSLAGDPVTIFRPYDHLWHVGLSMTWTYINGQNFWGGNTYIHGEGYKPLDTVGSTQHIGWDEITAEEQRALFIHRLEWVTSFGETWLSETRTIEVNTQHAESGIWSLDISMDFRNVSGGDLQLDSPTTKGRPMAGYGGLFWRGPRSFLHGKFFSEGGQDGDENIMSHHNRWVCYSGRHDMTNRSSSLIFVDKPENPRYPTQWWGRQDPYACVTSSFVYDEPYQFQADTQLVLSYRVLICNGEYDAAGVTRVLEQMG